MKVARLLFLSLFLTFILIGSGPVVAAETGGNWEDNLDTNDDGKHIIRIEASQWEFVAFDMAHVEKLQADNPAMSDDDAMAASEYKHRIGRFIKNTDVELMVYSRDVQHGFALNELGILLATNRPGVGEEFGVPVKAEFNTGNKDVTYSAFCHIFCGLGHPDMKLKFIIGQGSPETGRAVFYTILAINFGIFGFGLFKLATKMKIKPEEVVA